VRCHSTLEADADELVCSACAAHYPVVEDVAVLLPDVLTDQHRSQTQYFDSEFARYDTYEPENWRLSFNRRIFDALEVADGAEPYLDVGVGGSGATVIEAARRGVPAVGCDLSTEGVVKAARAARSEGQGERTSFVACAAEVLPFDDGAFGCASAVAVLEHLDDDAAAVAELGRVVRPGGRIWVTVPLAYRYILPPLWPAYLWHDRRIGHKRHYDEHALVRLFERFGLRHVATTYTGHAVKVLQLVLDRMLPISADARDRLWWSLERRDLGAQRRRYGALQLNAVFERAP
jgi:ubiquinone/menaquinone biosynthesis C-methylase UbiE